MDPRPIGVFDSGVGGLSVVRALQALLPAERLLYLADTAWFPYGPRPAAEIRKRSFAIARKLLDLNCKLIVIACNTASAAALADLRDAFPVAFVGMVPGVKPAAEHSPARHVVVLATPGTLQGELYADVVDRFGRATRVDEVAGTGLAEIVERGEAGTALARSAVRRALGAAVERGADAVVLGCTHYAFLAGDIREEFAGLQIVDTSEAVARRVEAVLHEQALTAEPSGAGGLDLIVSGDREEFRGRMRGLGFVSAAAPAEVPG